MSLSLFFKSFRRFTSFHTPLKPNSSSKFNIGFCKSVEVTCISEIGWRDTKKLVGNVNKFGNINTSQYKIEWEKENAAGSSSLITLESCSGKINRFLVDAGWNKEYMDDCYRREKIDKMLTSNQIDFLYLTHEHMDHFFGLENILKWNNNIPIVIPNSFSEEGYKIIRGETPTINKIKHEGPIYKTEKNIPYFLYEGCATYCFGMKIFLDTEGEQALYFNVKDKGLVGVTGCCHEGVVDFLEYGKNSIVCDKIHAIYGGLHIAPFGTLNEQQEAMIHKLGNYKLEKIACNHCTGEPAVDKMVEMGYPVIKGTGQYGSSGKFVGNGDKIKFN